MLVLSDNAATTIRDIVERPELPDATGLRIAGAGDGSGQLSVAPVATPEEDDQVIEDQGARVFLESDAAAILDDKVLDAGVDDEGRVSFFLGTQ